MHWGNLAIVLALALLGQQLARLLRLQAWALLGPMLLLSTLHAAGWVNIDLPRWLLAAAYALLGWHIGLGFRRDALIHAGRALPVVVAAAVCLIGLCGALAWCLTRLAHTDALTAYLATSPGGLDSVAIIATSTPHVDLPFVLALQALRLVFVILPGAAHHAPGDQALTASAGGADLSRVRRRSSSRTLLPYQPRGFAGVCEAGAQRLGSMH